MTNLEVKQKALAVQITQAANGALEAKAGSKKQERLSLLTLALKASYDVIQKEIDSKKIKPSIGYLYGSTTGSNYYLGGTTS